MTLRLDHVIIAVNDLDGAMADYRDLGFTVIGGGKHTAATTHNALVCFQDGTYLELLAPTGEMQEPGGMDFSALLQPGEGLVGYALCADDLEGAAAALRARGIAVGIVQTGGRRRTDGVELRWKTALIDERLSPFLIQDITPRNLRVPDDPAITTHANDAAGLASLQVATNPFAHVTIEHYVNLLDTMPERVEYQVHFRLGEATLQLMIPLDASLNRRRMEHFGRKDMPCGLQIKGLNMAGRLFDDAQTHQVVFAAS
jgi:hypothetical protein